MPQLSPLNWTILFIFFWFLLYMNSSIMWWNNKNYYNINKTLKPCKLIKYNW
uniref:ATP synthase F0 subunit 8 n=1 Tax=Amphitretus pelagicus TaxID=168639 RepID=UPI00226C733C|nr:ATP synthase F0 subunit 8 [Amphitretus pelagicus]UZN92543.1 ATP synthase F0 subunit 8 [Amphitretus pelagicus]